MIEILDKRKETGKTIFAWDIPLGYFYGVIDDTFGLYYKAQITIIRIESFPCGLSWELSSHMKPLMIRSYQPLDDSRVIIVIKD